MSDVYVSTPTEQKDLRDNLMKEENQILQVLAGNDTFTQYTTGNAFGMIPSNDSFSNFSSPTTLSMCEGCHQYHYWWYPTQWCNHKDSFKVAFQIVQKLAEKKLIELKNVKQFVELVNEIE